MRSTKTTKAAATADRSGAAVDLAAMKLLFAPREAAVILEMGLSTLYELLLNGTIHSVKQGRSRRITRAELERYVARLEAGQTAGTAA